MLAWQWKGRRQGLGRQPAATAAGKHCHCHPGMPRKGWHRWAPGERREGHPRAGGGSQGLLWEHPHPSEPCVGQFNSRAAGRSSCRIRRATRSICGSSDSLGVDVPCVGAVHLQLCERQWAAEGSLGALCVSVGVHRTHLGDTGSGETTWHLTAELSLQGGMSTSTQITSGGTSCFSSLQQPLDRGARSVKPSPAVLLAAFLD